MMWGASAIAAADNEAPKAVEDVFMLLRGRMRADSLK